MQLAQLLIHYQLTAQQLSKILTTNGIQTNLRFIKEAPNEWLPLLTSATGIVLPVSTGESQLVEKAVIDAVEEKKPVRVDLTNLIDLVPTPPPAAATDRKKEKKPPKRSNNGEKEGNGKNREYFYAYVKFVASDETHGFIKRLQSCNDITPAMLRARDDDDYTIKEDAARVWKDQIIVCSSRPGQQGKKFAKVEAVIFAGVVLNKGKEATMYELSSPMAPATFSLSETIYWARGLENTLVPFTLSSRNGKCIPLKAKETDLPPALREKGILEKLNMLTGQASLDTQEEELLDVIGAVADKGESLLQAFGDLFYKERKALDGTTDEVVITAFVDRWQLLRPEFIRYDKLNLLAGEDLLMQWYRSGKLVPDFFGTEHVAICLRYTATLPLPEQPAFFEKLKERLSGSYESLYTDTVRGYVEKSPTITSESEYLYCRKVGETVSEEIRAGIVEDLEARVDEETSLALWLTKKIKTFPKQLAIRRFGGLTPAQQDRVVKKLDEREVVELAGWLSSTHEAVTLRKCRKGYLEVIRERFRPISLDIESDGETIKQLAWGWGNDQDWSSGTTPTKVESALESLQKKIRESGVLLVGHNLVDFDCPILERHGLETVDSAVWDTLLVEMALSMELKTFALRTSHQALDDAKLAYELFINQVLRLIGMSGERWETMQGIFQPKIVQTLQTLRNTMPVGWLEPSILLEERLSFFRPQPLGSALVSELKEKLGASIAIEKVILAPTLLWDELAAVPGIRFSSTRNSDIRFSELDKDLLLAHLAQKPYWKALCLHFFNYCEKQGIRPLPANMPPAVRIRFLGQIDISACVKTMPGEDEKGNLCLEVADLVLNVESLARNADVHLFVVDAELITLSFKVLLKEIALAEITQNSGTSNLWIKFSGGQSFNELSKEQVEGLGAEIPAGISNFWIEKHVFGQYRIWGNYNWGEFVADFPRRRVTYIDRAEKKLPKEQTRFVALDAQKLLQVAGITRFNPETIYRSNYWVIQQELIRGSIGKVKNEYPNVLLVQRKEEVPTLEAYFQKAGFYIPPPGRPMGRRLEMLFENRGDANLLIVPIPEVNAILAANYQGALNIFLDSFNLYENFFLTKGSDLFKKSEMASVKLQVDCLSNEDASQHGEENTSEEVKNLRQKDIYFLLELLHPMIDRLRSLIHDNHDESILWLLDARMHDFPSLGEVWNARREVIQLWVSEESYKVASSIADDCIRSPKPIKDLPFSYEDSKQIMAAIFLGEGKDWYPEQVEYLDKILPAQTNLLVSLPTGGGKSLLFQAPALYRSSFTNRLTIVVTPLKALMEDQVKALWYLGFYGSVEYINSDRRDETDLIYRRLAGGEISLLFITPERFRSRGFMKAFTQRITMDGGLEYAVYDEAHCISQWGQDFRPDYLYSGKMVQQYKMGSQLQFPILLFSATVSEKIFKDFNTIFS